MRRLALLALLGCNQEPKSPYDIEVTQRSSALSIPERVSRVEKRLRADEAEAKETIGKLPSMTDKLTETDWGVVEQIVLAADEAGKDGAYAATRRELHTVDLFIQDEKDEITRKIASGVQYAIKQGKCEVDASGAVPTMFKDAYEERVEKRLQAANDAFLLIERHKEPLGKKNLPALEELATKLAKTSYVVHTEMVEAKLELESSVKSAQGSRAHIQRLIDEENKPTEGKQSNDALKAEKERIKNAEAKLRDLDTAESSAKTALSDLEQRTAELTKLYDDAFGKLKDAVKAKQK